MSAALSSLLRQTSIDDHEEVLKQCNEILKQNKADSSTQHVKVVALLQLNRFDDAVRVFDQGGESLKDRAALEYAYALYKSGNPSKAQEIVKEIDTRAGRLLLAQVSYRLEDFAKSAEIYEVLGKDPQGEDNDLRINLNASYAQLAWKHQEDLVRKKKADREDLEGFETAYNAACISIARGELGPAEILLRRAKDLCTAAEELSKEQKEEEISSIEIQQLYVLHASGKTQEAEKLAEHVSNKSIPDASTKHISMINRLAASGIQNPYLAQRKLEAIPSMSANDKLFEFQDALIRANELALNLSCSKLEGVKRSTAEQIAASPGPSLNASANIASSANAAAHAQNQLGKQGLKAILPLLEQRPNDVGLLVTIVQIYALTGNNGAAIHVIEAFFRRLDEANSADKLDVRFNPGLIAILVSLYAIEGRKAHIKDELAKAASYWKTRPNPPVSLLRAAGVSLLESGNVEDVQSVGEIFRILSKAKPNDRIIKAGLHASLSESKSALTPIERIIANIDTNALEQGGIPRSSQSTAAILKRKRAGPSSTKPRKRRIRKSKLPSSFDPEKKPDPERWLPLRDRSTYRPKGKKGKQKQSTATQGSNEKSADATGSQEKTTVATAPSGGNKSKKKKAKK